MKSNFISAIFHRYLKAFILIFLQISIWSSVSATPYLTIEDDIVMSQMIKTSTQPNELKLFLKLFPYSPYHKEIQQRLFRIEMRHISQKSDKLFDPSTQEGLTWTVDQKLTPNDEITMSRMVGQSHSPKELNLFLKLFPNSRFKHLIKDRKNALEQKLEVQDNSKSLQKVESEITRKINQQKAVNKVEKPPQVIATPSKEKTKQEKKAPLPKQEKKSQVTPPTSPENDWAKIEIGVPYALILQETNGTRIDTAGNPQGILLGWSDEIGLDIGMGATVEYFTQKLDNDVGELRHLFFETQLKARLFGHINLGIGYGGGYTTIALEENPDNRDITPGEGTITSMTVGTRLGSVGINFIMADFTGGYRWHINSGLNSSNGKERWKGTLKMITIEFLY